MIDLTVPAGQVPGHLLNGVIGDTLDRAADLAAPGAQPPQLDDTLRAVALARARGDHDALEPLLRDLSVAAIAARVRVLATAP